MSHIYYHEQPDSDIHGKCAAEIHRLQELVDEERQKRAELTIKCVEEEYRLREERDQLAAQNKELHRACAEVQVKLLRSIVEGSNGGQFGEVFCSELLEMANDIEKEINHEQ